MIFAIVVGILTLSPPDKKYDSIMDNFIYVAQTAFGHDCVFKTGLDDIFIIVNNRKYKVNYDFDEEQFLLRTAEGEEIRAKDGNRIIEFIEKKI
jgi:hypothetical protein